MKITRTGAAEYGHKIKALIAGTAGAGKTLISSTFPNPLYACAEPGLMSVADRNVAYTHIGSEKDLFELLKELDRTAEEREKALGFPVDTVIIDTLDDMQQILKRERMRSQKIDTMRIQDWGWLGERTNRVIVGFRDLDMHVVFTVHTKEVSDDNGRVWFNPNLEGSSGREAPAKVDLALLLRSTIKTVVDGQKALKVQHRYIQTFPDEAHSWIKDRSGRLPREFDVTFEDDYDRLHEYIFSGVLLPDSEDLSVDEFVSEEVVENSVSQEIIEEKLSNNATVDGPKTNGTNECSDCGAKIDSAAQIKISEIKYRKPLCRECFMVKK